MPDDKIGPRIMSSSTVRPTIVQAPAMRSDRHAPELTPGVSTVAQVRAVVTGMTVKAAKSRLEAHGFETRVVSRDGEPQEELWVARMGSAPT